MERRLEDSCAGMPQVVPDVSVEDTGTAGPSLEPVDQLNLGVFQDTEDDGEFVAELHPEVSAVVLRSLVCKEEVGHGILELAEEGSLSGC